MFAKICSPCVLTEDRIECARFGAAGARAGSGSLRREYRRKGRLARGQGACGCCIGLAFGQAMSQRNISLAFAGPSRVSSYLLPLHFACICSGAALQQASGFGDGRPGRGRAAFPEPQRNLQSKINIPQHSPPVMAGLLRADRAGQENSFTVIARRRNPAAVSGSGGDQGSFHQGCVGRAGRR
jgi:hypothetical protein